MTTLANNVLSDTIEEVANLYLMQSLLLTMQTNLDLLSQRLAGQIVNVSNVSMFALAAQYYNDATEWTTIANANGLSDPFVDGGQILQVNIINGGANYIQPYIFISGQEIVPANFEITNTGGVITNVKVISGGFYSVIPNIAILDHQPPTSAFQPAVLLPVCIYPLSIPQTAINTGGVLIN